MTIAELLHSLTCSGFSLAQGPDRTLAVKGDVSKLSIEQRRALKEHKEPLLGLFTTPTCLTFEEREREAIQFADTPEGRAKAEEPDIFVSIAAQRFRPYSWHTELWNWIGSKESLRELDALEELFKKMLAFDGEDEQLKTEIEELTVNRRALLVVKERHNQKASDPDAGTSEPL